MNTAMNDNELTLLFDLMETKYSSFSNQIDDKIEELIQASKSVIFSRQDHQESQAGDQRNAQEERV